MLGGRLLETENKRVYQISCLKSGRGRLRILSSGRLWESFETVFDWEKKKTVIYKVVAYGRWSLTRSGRYERVDCIKVCKPKIFRGGGETGDGGGGWGCHGYVLEPYKSLCHSLVVVWACFGIYLQECAIWVSSGTDSSIRLFWTVIP